MIIWIRINQISKYTADMGRKTYISSLFDTGINVDRIREIAGHEDERTSLNNYCFDTKIDKEFEKILDDVDYRLKIADSQ